MNAFLCIERYHRGTLWKLEKTKQQKKRITEPKDQRQHASELIVS